MVEDINSVKIEQEYGHYVVTINGNFYCSADTFLEAVREVEEIYETKRI